MAPQPSLQRRSSISLKLFGCCAFPIVVKSSSLGPFFKCSCPEGSKREPCKHAAIFICSLEKTCEYPAQVTAKEMQANRKRKNTAGRDPLAPAQNRYAAL